MADMDREAEPDDDVLVAEYLRDPEGRGGREAITRLVDRWSDSVYRWARRAVREREQALDLAQDSLIRMIEALPNYQPRGRFSAWLFVIVHHRCVSVVRKRTLNFDPEVDPDSLIMDGSDPSKEHESTEDRHRILAAMDALDTDEREALWLRAYEGMSVDDITRLLDVKGAAGARSLLQTARRKLRASLRAEEDREGRR